MMMLFALPLYLGLVRASRYYSQNVCACLWAIGHFAGGLFAATGLWKNVVSSVITYAAAWVVFKFVRESGDSLMRWLLVTGLGGALLVWFF